MGDSLTNDIGGLNSILEDLVKDWDKLSKDPATIYTLRVKFQWRVGVIELGIGIVFVGIVFGLLLEREAIYISLILICTGLIIIYFGYKLCRDFQKKHFKGRKIWTFWGMMDYYKRN
jgi:hypothetical protein